MTRSLQFWITLSAIVVAMANPCFASENAESIRNGKHLLSEAGCLDNVAFTEICKNWSGLVSTNEDILAFAGDPVCVTFQTQSLSRSKKELTGSFLGQSGVFAEDIYIIANFKDPDMLPKIEKGESVLIEGHMPAENVFRSNVSDSCFAYVDAEKVSVDGF